MSVEKLIKPKRNRSSEKKNDSTNNVIFDTFSGRQPGHVDYSLSLKQLRKRQPVTIEAFLTILLKSKLLLVLGPYTFFSSRLLIHIFLYLNLRSHHHFPFYYSRSSRVILVHNIDAEDSIL